MKNKTCGECKYHVYGTCILPKNGMGILEEEKACRHFKQKTNGDVIRAMNNEELAGLIVPKVMFCNGCPVKCAEKDIPKITDNKDPFGADIADDICKQRVKEWLEKAVEK